MEEAQLRQHAYEIAAYLAEHVRDEYDTVARFYTTSGTYAETADGVADSHAAIEDAVRRAEAAYLEVAELCGPAPGAFQEPWFDQDPGCTEERASGTGGGTSGGGGGGACDF